MNIEWHVFMAHGVVSMLPNVGEKKLRRLVQNDMSTAVMWSKSKLKVEFQYGRRLGEFNGILSQNHVPHCRVKEFQPPY